MADEQQDATSTDDKGATPAPEPPKDPALLGEAGEKALEAWKARAREAERKAKELAPLADKARELEDAQRSEVEKAQAKASKAERERDDANARLLRYDVAREKEIPAKLVPLLTATSKDELEKQADLILETANPKEPEREPDFDGGPREPAGEVDPAKQHNREVLKLLGLN